MIKPNWAAFPFVLRYNVIVKILIKVDLRIKTISTTLSYCYNFQHRHSDRLTHRHNKIHVWEWRKSKYGLSFWHHLCKEHVPESVCVCVFVCQGLNYTNTRTQTLRQKHATIGALCTRGSWCQINSWVLLLPWKQSCIVTGSRQRRRRGLSWGLRNDGEKTLLLFWGKPKQMNKGQFLLLIVFVASLVCWRSQVGIWILQHICCRLQEIHGGFGHVHNM